MSLMLTSLNLFTGPQHRGAYFTHNIIDYALLGHVNLYFMLTLPHLFLLLFNCASNNAFVLRTTDEKAGEHLIYVQAIWRHGDRAPHHLPYPRDLNDESSWPRGWSQLTNMGIKQLYELGLFLRKRYNGYIKEFNPADIRILTSRSDRAIVSAQAMLRGFFPVDNIAMQWLKDELWQPISFHSESIERNAPLLHSTLHACSHYNQLMKNETAVIADEMMEKYADVVHLLANVTGIGEELNFDRAAALIDIQREILHQLPQPEWVYQKWPQFQNMSTIDIITEFKRINQISKYNTFEKAKFKGGLLLGDILHRFHNVSVGTKVEARKMFLYSAHDSTLLSLQHALNISNGLLVPYSACLIMELYKTEKNETTLKILYKNETENANAYELFVPNCSIPCKLNQLIKLSAPTILDSVDDLNKICEKEENGANKVSGKKALSNHTGRHVTMMFSISSVLMLLYLFLISC
ncbi:unnamed protein product [Brugia pahangi]|uniref:Lysosomal acid phosphatase n=1 Tax=Brugia pahangi TaxID=6280 RepID=A0A0N4TNB8_BRUPA|nr:unnamed protein product [Brugia pahangi]